MARCARHGLARRAMAELVPTGAVGTRSEVSLQRKVHRIRATGYNSDEEDGADDDGMEE